MVQDWGPRPWINGKKHKISKLSHLLTCILRHRGAEWGLKVTREGFASVNEVWRTLKAKRRIDPRDTLSSLRWVLHHQGVPKVTGVVPGIRYETFVDTNGDDWARCAKGAGGIQGAIAGEQGMTALQLPSQCPLLTYHCTTLNVLPLILLATKNRSNTHPGGLLPGGVNGEQYRRHIHTAEFPIYDWRSSRGCRDMPVQIEISAREAVSDGQKVFRAADGCILFLGRLDPFYIKRVKIRNSGCPLYKHSDQVNNPEYETLCSCGHYWPEGTLICGIPTCMRALTKIGVRYELNNLPISKPQKAALLWYRYNLRVRDVFPDMTDKASREWFIDDDAYNAFHDVFQDPARALGVHQSDKWGDRLSAHAKKQRTREEANPGSASSSSNPAAAGSGVPDQPASADNQRPLAHPANNAMILRKAKKAFKDGYRGHSDRFDKDEEYRDNCIRQGFPRVMYLHTAGYEPMDVDDFCFERKQREENPSSSTRR